MLTGCILLHYMMRGVGALYLYHTSFQNTAGRCKCGVLCRATCGAARACCSLLSHHWCCQCAAYANCVQWVCASSTLLLHGLLGIAQPKPLGVPLPGVRLGACTSALTRPFRVSLQDMDCVLPHKLRLLFCNHPAEWFGPTNQGDVLEAAGAF